MISAFEDATVTGWESLVEAITFGNDPDDRHVLAAAVRGRAEAVVTKNLHVFPTAAMADLGPHAIDPDDFLPDLADLADLAPDTMVEILWLQSEATGRPPLTPSQVLDSLAKAGAPHFADYMRPLVG